MAWLSSDSVVESLLCSAVLEARWLDLEDFRPLLVRSLCWTAGPPCNPWPWKIKFKVSKLLRVTRVRLRVFYLIGWVCWFLTHGWTLIEQLVWVWDPVVDEGLEAFGKRQKTVADRPWLILFTNTILKKSKLKLSNIYPIVARNKTHTTLIRNGSVMK